MSSRSDRRPGFAVNTLWSWTSVAVNVVIAFFVSPLMIHRLGDEAYGAWALAFSIVEYYALLDLGVKSALVKYVAHDRALGEDEGLNRTLNTAFLYMTAMSGALILVTLVVAPLSPRLFVISPQLRGTFVYVMALAGVSLATSLVFGCFAACLEAVQRFDLSNRITIAANLARVAGIIAMLQLGFGLRAVVTAAVASRVLQGLWLWRAFHQQFPHFRWGLAGVNRASFRKLFAFGLYNVPSNIGWLLLLQGPGIVIGHAMPTRFVGYYALPRGLIMSILDFVQRLGLITTARTAELVAHRQRDALIRLGIQSNRYSLVVFMPAAIFLAVYGDAVFRVWLTPEFAATSAPLLWVFLAGTLLADASHFNSSSMLYGMAKHQLFSWILLAEGIVSLALVYHFVQQGSLLGAAASSAAVMVLNRGCVTPFLLCRHLKYPFMRYVAQVAVRPLAAGVLVAAALRVCRITWLPGRTFFELGLAGALTTLAYFLVAGRFCALEEHQAWFLTLIRDKAPFFEKPIRQWLGVRQLKPVLSTP